MLYVGTTLLWVVSLLAILTHAPNAAALASAAFWADPGQTGQLFNLGASAGYTLLWHSAAARRYRKAMDSLFFCRGRGLRGPSTLREDGAPPCLPGRSEGSGRSYAPRSAA